MAKIQNISFQILSANGDNYLQWALDVKLHLSANGLKKTIEAANTTTDEEKAKSIILLRHHIHDCLKSEYLTIENPLTLWTDLKDRFDHQKMIFLPAARHDWSNLRLLDYKSVSDYNSAMFRITSQLKLCGETVTDAQMLEKTLSTFHPQQIIIAQQYRMQKFTKYSDLNTSMLAAEKNDQILIKNHQARPVGASALPEANNATFQQNVQPNSGKHQGRKQWNKHGRGNKQGKNFRYKSNHLKWFNPNFNKGKGKVLQTDVEKDVCHRCGIHGHWSRTCRTAKHLVELYQTSKKNKGKEVETNYVNNNLQTHNSKIGDGEIMFNNVVEPQTSMWGIE